MSNKKIQSLAPICNLILFGFIILSCSTTTIVTGRRIIPTSENAFFSGQNDALLATTFTRANNDTVSLLSTFNASILARTPPGGYIPSYDNAAYDSTSSRAFLYGIEDGMNILDIYSIIQSNLHFMKRLYLQGQDALLVHIYPVPFSLDNAAYDASENRIVGLVNDVFAYLDLTSGKFVTIQALNFASIGFRQLGASTISSDSRFYFVFYENHNAESFFVRVDLKTLSYRVNQVYDLIGLLIYIPSN
ncbi:hypothetical protein C9374_002560 [Naegleria lovaniensis]|uniref:Uncharacterized protein n=1 Tax=Naegleria lovaniensis TaxID=51637 RepID=A0AA88GU08_NAELO|nr:uncharacterized protein C9374_002560 [Naegleria lovaniensis]KAG2386114.1 hypothetical protein C9374_002560 [Naegleria lovaniensis]